MPQPRSQLAPALAFLTGARLVVNTAHRFVYPFLPAISRGLGVSLDTAGLLVSARWGAGLATPALVAVIGRAERRKRLIAFSLVLFALGATVTAATGLFVGALVGFVLMGLAKPVYDISAQAYLADRVPYESRARFLAVLELTWAGSLLIGAPAAGWLIDRSSWTAPFWAIAVLAAAAFWLQARVLEPDLPAAAGSSRSLAWDRSAATFLVVVALFNAGSEMMFVVFGAWLEGEFSLSLVALGGTAVMIGLVELASEGSTIAFTDRIGKRRAVAIGLVISVIGFGLLAVFDESYGLGMAALLIGIGGFEFTIVSSIPLATEVRPHSRTKYLSWMIVATAGGRALGAAVGSPLFGWGGIEVNALIAAGVNAAAIGVLLAWVRETEPGASDFPADFVLPE
jgi:predicted MFS family arabinose efflux permease